MLRLAVLGPVRAWDEDSELNLGPPQQRTVLAVLLAEAGHPVPRSALVEALWGAEPPTSAVNILHRYVGGLRRTLEPGLPARARGSLLLRHGGGYRIDVEAVSLDLVEFRRLRGRAHEHLRSADTDAALDHLSEALRLWRGPYAADTRSGDHVPPVFVAVEQEYLAATQEAADLSLRTDRAEQVLPQVRQAAATDPLNESLQARQMLLLAAAGRQAEALNRYQVTRRLLLDELGIDPGPELQAAHEQVLRPHTIAAPAPASSRPAAHVPEQLPAAVAVFVGRRDRLDALDTLLTPGAPTSAVISGSAGMGKTALAVHWGHRVADRFPDGQLHVNLRGFDPTGQPMRPGDAVRTFLHALGVPAQRIPDGLPAQSALYRSVLARRRILVVADNAYETEQVRPLIPGTPGCLVLVTSRRPLTGLVATEGAVPITLDLLSVAESRQMLIERLGARRVAAEPYAVDALIAACARLPLALAVVAARAAINPTFPLDTFSDQLCHPGERLDALHGGDAATEIRAVFSWSYRQLSLSAGRLFRLFGLHPGPELGVVAAASLVGVDIGAARALLAELTEAGLVVESAPARYGQHDLLRSYADELAGDVDPADDQRAALRRLLDHYLHTTDVAHRRLNPRPEPLDLAAAVPGSVVTRFDDCPAARAWFDTELPTLLAAVCFAAGRDLTTVAWQLADCLHTFLHHSGRWHDIAEINRTVLDAAECTGDRPGVAHSHHRLGIALSYLNHFEDAYRHLHAARTCFEELGDQAGQARIELSLGSTLERQQEAAQAMPHARRALDLARAAGDTWLQARALNAIGWQFALTGEYEQTHAYCERALLLFEELDDPDRAADCWDSIGFANHHLGRHAEAVDCYRRALRMYRALRNRFFEAATLIHLGQTHSTVGRTDQARTAWLDALAILNDLDHPDAEEVEMLLRRSDDPVSCADGVVDG